MLMRYSLAPSGYFRLTDRFAAGIHASNAGIATQDSSLLRADVDIADERQSSVSRDLQSFNAGKRTVHLYSPLSQDDIRLLHIHSSEDSTTPLHASLVHIALPSAQSRTYVALSYTWGLMEANVPILLDGKTLRIRPNLARILQILRDLQVQYIWVSRRELDSHL